MSAAAEVVGPTLAVVVLWAAVAALLAGIGRLVRRGLAPGREPPRSCADCWIGLATLVAYLVVWNLFLPIDATAAAAPLIVGVVGLAGALPRQRPRPGRAGLVIGAVVGLASLWLANRALGPADDYDYGLYHLDIIRYAEHYATVPGLGNLQTRLGAADPHLLLVALLDSGPLRGAGPHLANGLLASMLLLDIGLRAAKRPLGGDARSFSWRLALLLAPATVIAAGLRPNQRISSPNLDYATFVLVCVGALYFAEHVEHRFGRVELLVAAATLSLAAATRPLYVPEAVFVVAFALRGLVGGVRRLAGAAAQLASCAALPLLLEVTSAARQAILTGYPFLPSTVVALSVSWRVPEAAIAEANRIDAAWARWSGVAPATVLASWHWLSASWLPDQEVNLDVLAPLALLACVLPSLLASWHDPGRRARRGPMLAVVLPGVATLGLWFALAPDPRYAWAPLWLVPAALVAWVLPTRLPRGSRAAVATLAAAGLALAVAIASLAAFETRWLVPVLLAGFAASACLAAPLGRDFLSNALPLLAVGSILVGLGGELADLGAFHPVVANRQGPLGIPRDPTPRLVSVETSSGLRLLRPAVGNQCFGVLLCVPALNRSLRLRGSGVADGFTVEPPQASRRS